MCEESNSTNAINSHQRCDLVKITPQIITF